MSTEQARLDISGAVEAGRAAWTAPAGFIAGPLQLQAPNRNNVDVDKLPAGAAFVALMIDFMDGGQLSLGPLIQTRQTGVITIVACARVNDGTSKQQKLVDYFQPLLELRKLGVLVKTHAAATHRDYEDRGWSCVPLVVPFWYERLVSRP